MLRCAWLFSTLTLASAAAAMPPVGSTAHTQRIAVRAPVLFEIAERMIAAGDVDQAETVLDALTKDPDSDIRNEARFRQSRLLRSKGKKVPAAVLLRQIVDERPAAVPARVELAQLLQSMGDTDGAWRQMRAVQTTGLTSDVARLLGRYADSLRNSRGAGVDLELALAPDSNINHATSSDSLGTIFGDFDIADDSKARSGTGLALRGQAFRRVAIGADASVLARVSGFGNLYRQGRYNDLGVDIAVGPELAIGRSRLALEVGGTQRWYGQTPFVRSARLGASLIRPLGSRMQMRLKASGSLIDNQLNDLQDGKGYSAMLGIERALTPTTGMGFSIAADRLDARDPGYSTTGWRAGLTGWRDFGRLTIAAEAYYGRLTADRRLLLFPDRRSDRSRRLALSATFRQVNFLGFSPLVRLNLERNKSTIAFYDYRQRRTEVGISRAF